MNLTAEERRMLDGAEGEAIRQALEYQIQVGQFFEAEDFVPVRSAHVMADAEALRDAGIAFLEALVERGARFRIPTTTNPRSVDFEHVLTLGQRPIWPEREQRIIHAFQQLGAVQCHTCINYQTVDQPLPGEHLAWGDTGTVIWANSICGARSNFEAGPAALMAGITGRVPRYGFHFDAVRQASIRIQVETPLLDLSDWGALGCWAGRRINGYWTVPAFALDRSQATPDGLKHLGAALASFGSCAMFHIVGLTPAAPTEAAPFADREPTRRWTFGADELSSIYRSFEPERPEADLVVFSAPQLSEYELRDLAALFAGRQVADGTRCYLTTNRMVYADAAASGYTLPIERAGAVILQGVCFYLLVPQELAADHGYRTLVTNSAKLANILGGYGYSPSFRPTEVCVEAAVTGRLPW